MGKKDKNKKKGLGAEKTSMKTEKKASLKQKKMLAKIGEVRFRACGLFIGHCLSLILLPGRYSRDGGETGKELPCRG